MSTYGGVDINRLIADQQRLQHDLALSQERYHRALEQGQMLLATNQSLRKEKERFEAQRKGEVEHLMASHRELYEKELTALRDEREHLLRRLEVFGEQQQLNNSLQTTVQILKGQLEHSEQQLRDTQNQLEQAHRALLDPFALETVKSLQQQHEQELEAEVREKKAAQYELLIKTGQSKQLNNQIIGLKRAQEQQKEKIDQLTHQKYELEGKMPMDLVRQLSVLREQRDSLLSRIEIRTFQSLTEDEQLYGSIQQLHAQIALLRLELSDSHHRRQQAVAELHQARAKLHLQTAKAQKEREVSAEEVKEVTLCLERTKADLRDRSQSENDTRSLQEEAALLKIKLFALEALNTSERYRRQRNYELKQFEIELKRLLGTDPPVNSVEVLKLVVELRAAVGDLTGRVAEQQGAKAYAQRKYRHYKNKYRALVKESRGWQEEAKSAGLAYKQRVNQYNCLVEKLESELQRALEQNIQASERRNLHLLVAPYQQRVQLINTEVIMLQGQLRQCQATAKADTHLYQQQVTHLKQQVQIIRQQNSLLSAKCRRLEGQLLDQALLNGQGNATYQTELAHKQQALAALEQQLQQAKNMNAQHLKSLKASQQRSFRQFKKELAKSQMLSAEKSHKQQANVAQVEAMRLKLQGFQQLFENYRFADTNSKAIALSEELGTLRAQHQRIKSDYQCKENKLAEAQLQNQGYRVRLVELQECLKRTVEQYENKLRSQQLRNNKLKMSKERLQQQMGMIQSRQASERDISLLQTSRNSKRNEQTQQRELKRLQDAITAKEGQLDSLKINCEQLQQENLKLIATLREHNIQSHTIRIETQNKKQEQVEKVNLLQRNVDHLQRENRSLKEQVQNQFRQLYHSDKEGALFAQIQFKNELAAQKDKVNYLKNELRSREEQITRFQSQGYRQCLRESGTYALKELSELRQEIQQLRNSKFENLERIRELQQENNRLKVRQINEDMTSIKSGQQGFIYKTFGPTSSMAKGSITKQHLDGSANPSHTDDYLKALENRISVLQSIQKQHQQTLAVLTIVMAENDSLRARVEQAQVKAQKNYQYFIGHLRQEGQALDDVQVNAQLIKELQHAHRNLLETIIIQSERIQSEQILAISTSDIAAETTSRANLQIQKTSSEQLVPCQQEEFAQI